jgi:hypothetical protein
LILFFPIMLPRYFLNEFEMVPVAPVTLLVLVLVLVVVVVVVFVDLCRLHLFV